MNNTKSTCQSSILKTGNKRPNMSSTDQTIVAFDLYGTLLSTESIAKKLGDKFGQDKADKLAADWRTFQLEYTWRANSMGELQHKCASIQDHVQAPLGRLFADYVKFGVQACTSPSQK